MMKKNGFTLAEVLITLAIIGVVATLTLPALMTNTQEQQAKSAFKKGLSTLTEAAQMNQAIDNFDFARFSEVVASPDEDDVENSQSMMGLLVNRTAVDTTLTLRGDAVEKVLLGATGDTVVFFRDGTALAYTGNDTITGQETADDGSGLPVGYNAVFDTNGAKGPNYISNCSGNLVLRQAIDESEEADCDDKNNRAINDQFNIMLRGGYALPQGGAARWVANN